LQDRNAKTTTIDVSQLVDGVYFVLLKTGQGTALKKKIIIAR